jgi:hypothetical protein
MKLDMIKRLEYVKNIDIGNSNWKAESTNPPLQSIYTPLANVYS